MSPSPRPVLLVEDDADDQLLMERALGRTFGHSVHVAEDGDEAVDYLRGRGKFADRDKHPLPDLVLLDLMLPRRSGFEVLEWLRSHPGLKRLPVVVLTSSNRPADVKGAYDRGANSYVVKPMNVEELRAMAEAIHEFWLTWNRTASLDA